MKRLMMLCVLALCACNSSQPASRSAAIAASKADVTFEAIRFETSKGPFTAILYPEVAPETVARYQEYVDSGYFVGRSFDRVVPGFVIQLTDCAISAVTRDSQTLPLEPSEDYFFSAGALGIARAASENSGGPEFFVMDFAAAHLNTQYTVFGQVVEGMDVVRKAARVMAVDLTAGAQVPAVVGDRCALMPVEITATARTTVTMSAQDAARYPLHTATRVRTDTASYNLEWPATLAAKRETDLTAYVRMVDESQAPPAAQDVSVIIAGVPIAVEGGAVAGIYHFRWTPKAAAIYDAVISAAGTELATLQIEVR
ncbi:MAG: peptidylprolyl isomerase [Pseudomonadota bacterium]